MEPAPSSCAAGLSLPPSRSESVDTSPSQPPPQAQGSPFSTQRRKEAFTSQGRKKELASVCVPTCKGPS